MTVSDSEMELAGPVSQDRRILTPTSRLLPAQSDTEMDLVSEPAQPAKAHSDTEMDVDPESGLSRHTTQDEFQEMFRALCESPYQNPNCRDSLRTRAKGKGKGRAKAKDLRRARGPRPHNERLISRSQPAPGSPEYLQYVARWRSHRRQLREVAVMNRLEQNNPAIGQSRDQSRMDICPDQVADGAPQESGTADVDMDTIRGSLSDLILAQTDGPSDGVPPQGNRQH